MLLCYPGLVGRVVIACVCFALLVASAWGADGGGQGAGERMAALRAEVARHDALYYEKASPEISDGEYDALVRELRELEAAFGDAGDGADGGLRIGDDRVEGVAKWRHGAPMLSLEKGYAEADVEAFHRMVMAASEGEAVGYVIEPKYDGMAVSLTYERGRFVRATTRGDGAEGDDVSANVLTIAGVPRELGGTGAPDLVEIRGEIYLTFAAFERVNRERAERGEDGFATPRNLAAGSAKLADAGEAAERGLSLVVFGYGAYEGSGGEPVSQSAFYELARGWGLPVVAGARTAGSAGELVAAIGAMETERAGYGFPTDGVVVKVDERSLQRRLGESGVAPRWALAYKFAARRVETRLLGIAWQVGRSGMVTPVAELEPALIEGVLVGRATLHNAGFIERHDLRVGDVVAIERAGEVIPAVAGVNRAKRSAESEAFVAPVDCPSCGVALERSGTGAGLRCGNGGCPAQLQRRLEHFVSRAGVNIEGLGPATIAGLVARGELRDLPDIYRLAGVEAGLRAEIERSTGAELWRFVAGLGIPGVGEARARELARVYGSLEALAGLEAGDFEVGGRAAGAKLGASVRAGLVAYFGDAGNRGRIAALVEVGVAPVVGGEVEEGALSGKIFVFTGRLPGLSRAEATRLVERAGGVVASRVTRGTDYIVVGEEPGFKLEAARALGVTVLVEGELKELLGEDEE